MILLNNNYLLSRGSERTCYIHPFDTNKVIKIIYNKKELNNNQNDLEFKYYSYLNSKNISYEHITKCFGWVDTNLGKGLVFERVLNYDNSIPKQLTHFLQHKIFTIEEETLLLNELKTYLETNKILFMDVATLNVLCKKISSSKYKLIIIDGLGPKRDGLKFWLYTNIELYNTYKQKKQWNKFIKLVNRVKASY